MPLPPASMEPGNASSAAVMSEAIDKHAAGYGWSGLHARLMSVTILALLPLCVLVVTIAISYYHFVATSTFQKAGALAHLLATDQERHIQDARSLLTALAGIPDIKARRGNYCSILADALRLQAPDYMGLGMTDADGKAVCNDSSLEISQDLVSSPWFLQSLKARKFFIGTYRIEASTGKAVVMLVLPTMDQAGQVQGSIYAMLDIAWIARMNVLSVLPQQSIFLMFDDEGLILRRNPDPEKWEGKRLRDAPFIKAIVAQKKPGVVELSTLDGIRRLVAFETLASQRGNVHLVVGIPSEGAFAQLHRQFFAIGIWIALAVIVVLAIAWTAGEKLITEKIRRMMAVARQFGHGDQSARNGFPYTADEIGALAHT